MKKVLLRLAIKLNKERKRRRTLQKVIQAMAALVVFCTTYALILPAITMEQERICGLQMHRHEERCYESYSYQMLSCSVSEESGTLVLHSHGRECYDREGNLCCTLTERPAHTHGESCYGQPAVVCGQEETPDHVHSNVCTTERVLICLHQEGQIHLHDDSCSQREHVLICTLPQTQGHSHAEAGCDETCELPEEPAHAHGVGCYNAVFTGCDQPENVPHLHEDACYEIRAVECPIAEGGGHTHGETCFGEAPLICQTEEIQPHHHDENCYDSKGTMNCGKQEIVLHTHGENCMTDTGEVIRELICTLEEHEHQDICYAEASAAETSDFLCGYGEHIHEETCFDEAGLLVCTIPEHTHVAACVTTELDLTDAVETPETWDAMFQTMAFTGNWREDLVAVAQSQVSYQESTKNCILVGQQLKGYSRYGARYELPYENWNMLFVRFCMDYAGIRYYPWQNDAAGWITQLRQQQLFHETGTYTPKPGDLVFICQNVEVLTENMTLEEKLLLADHAGIVSAWIPETEGTPAAVKTVEGDVKDRVCSVAYEAGDRRILGYGEMLPGYAETMYHAGEDYSVTVSLTAQARIPRNAKLSVREILPETEEYETFYRQAVESLMARTRVETEADLGVAFARFFDIGFAVNGAQIEPEAPVDVQIRYAQPIAVPQEHTGTAVHFTDSGIELLDAAVSGTAVPADAEPEAPSETEAAQETTPPETEAAQETTPPETEAVQETTPSETEAAQETTPPETEAVQETTPPETVATEETVPAETEEAESGEPEAAAPEEPAPKPMTQVDTFAFTQNSFSVTGTVVTSARKIPVSVWLDGTCGNLMAFGGSEDRLVYLNDGRLPTTWDSPDKYAYTLKGWYDVTHGVYYPLQKAADGSLVGPVVNENVGDYTVFYADWVAASYDIGKPNSHTVNSLDTNEFVTTHLFDYNALFNFRSVRLSDSYANSGDHNESWTLVELGDTTPTRNGTQTLDFIFRDHDAAPELSHPQLPDGSNTRNEPTEFNAIYDGLYTTTLDSLLFDPAVEAVGKTYLGQGNYLFQYEDNVTSDYYGYYYYDSSRNAASYNASANRFYVYDYKIFAQDTIDNNLHGQNADFLPLNYPPANTNLNGQIVYASKENQSPAAMANLNFAMSTNIHFYLPHPSGATDSNGNYLNKSTTGDSMVFEFFGDDDVWVMLDGELLLDIGGIHQVRKGVIDFSAGVVRTTKDGSTNLNDMDTVSIASILGEAIPEGPHNLEIYYLERGSSMSNCAIYFNLAPRYGLDVYKTDYITGAALPGVEFEVFNDASCTVPATLWRSHEEARTDSQNKPFQKTTNVFTTGSDGKAHMWGLVAGKTYYLREKTVPTGYPKVNALIRVTLNNHGTDISEITVIRNGEGTEGFEVTAHSMNKESHQITVHLTNKQTDDMLTAIRAEKTWGAGVVKENPVQIYLMANGEQLGEDVILSADNTWGHTWMDLPLTDASGRTIVYSVEERPLHGYIKSMEKTVLTENRITWVKVGVLDNGSTFLLSLDGSNALSGSVGTFRTATIDSGRNSSGYYWLAEAYEDGFRLRTEDGYYLTFSNTGGYFYLTTAGENNQTLYYDGTNLFVMSGNNRYYPTGVSGNQLQASQNVDSTNLYKQIVTRQGTTLFHFTNTPIPEDRQKPLLIEKKWEGEAPEIPESILIHVKKDDSIQATVELTAANQWKGQVEGLDGELLSSGGYTLEEELPFGFAAQFGEIIENTTDEWYYISGNQNLVSGEIYAFVSNNRALADDGGVPRATSFNGTPTRNQCWQVVETVLWDNELQQNRAIQVLRNVETNRYLQEYGPRQNYHEFTMVEHAGTGCEIRLKNSRLQFYIKQDDGGWSITLNNDGSLSTQPGWGPNSGTSFTVCLRDYHSEYLVTLTNTYATYVLPETGGMGSTPYHAFGGLLILAAALMYLYINGRRRQRGGR